MYIYIYVSLCIYMYIMFSLSHYTDLEAMVIKVSKRHQLPINTDNKALLNTVAYYLKVA